MAIRHSRERHISPCSIASDSRAVEMRSCRCIETWHVDTGARADVGPTLQGGTACVVSNAKFAASVDPSPQTSGPEAVDAGQSSASKARYKSGGDVRRHWSLSRTSRSGTLHAWVPRACAGCGVRMRDVMRPTPRVQRAFVLRPLAHPSGTSSCTSVPELASREIHSRSWQQDAIASRGTSGCLQASATHTPFPIIA